MADSKPPAPQPPQRASNGAVALAAALGISIATAVGISSDVQQHESSGRVILKAYRDSGGVWTDCDGIIRWPNGQPVREGDVATPEQCEAARYDALMKHGVPLVQCLPALRGRDNQVRALIDLSYNVGVAGICTGSVGRDIRAGGWAAASDAILPYDKVSFDKPQPGLQCFKKKSGPKWWACTIPGLSNRRRDNKRRFDMARPADGTLGPVMAPVAASPAPKPAPAPVAAPKPVTAAPVRPAEPPKPAPPPPKRGFWAWLRGIF